MTRKFALAPLLLASLLLVLAACTPLLLTPVAARSVDVELETLYGDTSANLFQAAQVAYSMEDTGVTLSSSQSTLDPMLNALYGASPTVDFLVLSQEPSTITYDTTTLALVETNAMDITGFPIAGSAVAPIYNLGSRTITLCLTRQNMVDIMLGEITRWDDSRLASYNPGLPAEDIIMVLPTSRSSQTLALARSLKKFNATQWAASGLGTPSDFMNWPSEKYAANLSSSLSSGVVSIVLATKYSFSFSSMPYAVPMSASMAQMVNLGGQVVAASTDSIKYSLIELGSITSDDGTTSWSQDISDGTGYGSWPMAFMIAVYLPTSYSRTTCTAREALVTFWEWFFASGVVSDFASELGLSILPALTYTTLDLADFFSTTLVCEGASVYTSDDHQVSVYGLSIGTVHSALDTSFLAYYSALDSTYDYSLTTATELQALQQLKADETDLALIAPDQFKVMSPGVLEPYIYSLDEDSSSDSLAVLPYALYAVVPTINLPSAVETKFAASLPLVLDLATLGRIFAANITSWTDYRIEALNPGLTAAFTKTGSSPNITLVVCCDDGEASPATNALVTTLNKSSNFFAAVGTWTLPPTWTDVQARATAANMTFLQVNTEVQLASAVARLSGSIGYRLSDNGTSEPTTDVKIKRFTAVGTLRSTAKTSGVVTTYLTQAVNSLQQCILAVEPSVNYSTYSVVDVVPTSKTLSTLSKCWPLTFMTALVMPSTYSTTSDSSACTRANRTLTLAQWALTDSDLTNASSTRGMIRLSNLTGMSDLQNDVLNSLTCDGSTVLTTFDSVWTLDSSVTSVAWALSGIGLGLLGVVLVLLIKYRHRSVLRSASVPFQFLIISGLAMMFVAVGLWGQKATDANCQALAWLVNIGFTLTFASLFAKMWRVYKIFDRRSVGGFKISNEKLAIGVACLIVKDIIINLVWQLYSAPYAGIVSHTNSAGVTWDYDVCTGDSESLPFIIVILVLKGILLTFGTFIGFTTRNVSSTFNESRNVAWAIYNVFLAGGVLVPVIIFGEIYGDTYTVLLVVLTFWVSIWTMACNFGTKFILLFNNDEATAIAHMLEREQEGEAISGSSSHADKSRAGFSFPSLAKVPQAVLDRYIASLETHIRAAKVRHQAMLEDGDTTAAAKQRAASRGPTTAFLIKPKQTSSANVSVSGGGGGGGGGGGPSRDVTPAPTGPDAYRIGLDDETVASLRNQTTPDASNRTIGATGGAGLAVRPNRASASHNFSSLGQPTASAPVSGGRAGPQSTNVAVSFADDVAVTTANGNTVNTPAVVLMHPDPTDVVEGTTTVDEMRDSSSSENGTS